MIIYQGANETMSTTMVKKINPEDRRLKQKLTPKQMLFVTNYVQQTLTGKISASDCSWTVACNELKRVSESPAST